MFTSLLAPQRPRNPIVPGSIKERTGTSGILRRAVAEINSRWAGLQTDVVDLFSAIPIYAANDVGDRTIYGLSVEQMEILSTELQVAVDRWIAGARDPTHTFWWDGYVQESAQLGAAQSAANLTNLSATYAASRNLHSIIFSEPYKNRLAMAQNASYEHWTGLAVSQRTELAQIIGRAVVDGKNPRAVVTEIAERLDVSRARAAGYAQTDITGTLRQTRWAEADYTETDMGISLALLWTSALLPTTRHWHASRNGQVYTTEEVRTFYSQGGNRYRCHCAQTEALLDADGNAILTKKLKSSMANEYSTWKSQQPTE